MEREKRVCVRVSEEEMAILKEAAWARRLTLSDWVRQTMLREARKAQSRASAPAKNPR